MVTKKEQKFLLELARKAIIKYSTDRKRLEAGIVPAALKARRGVFVTLTIGNELRGCIGYILPINEICNSVIDNAINAAYHDPRFPPLSKEEIDMVRIEISILTNPIELKFKDNNDLLNKLNPGLGVILKKGLSSATFLPQVWEQLPDKEEFLEHLCMKAGISYDEWKKNRLSIETYKVEKFKE